jgi:hypothetical protein
MSPELQVYNRELLCTYEIVIEKYLKIIYEGGSKILKYVVSFYVYPYAFYIYSTSLWFVSST